MDGMAVLDDAEFTPIRRKLDVYEYHRMVEAGILHEDSRVELIDGDLIEMAPIGQDHAATVNGLTYALVMACGDRAIVSVQNPIRIDLRNEPQPDFAVLRSRPDRYRTGDPPGGGDVLLLVEVADSSLRYDRTVKLRLYARAGAPEYWIVDLKHRVLDAYRRPAEDGYGERTTHRPGEKVALALAPEIVVPLNLVFG